MSNELQEIIDRAKQRIRAKVSVHLNEEIEKQLTPEAIERWMLGTLERERQVMMDRLLGIDRRWSQPDFTKDGLFMKTMGPIMSDKLRPMLEADLGPMLEEIYEKQRPKLQAEFKKHVTSTFERSLQWEVESLARKRGEELAEKAIREMKTEIQSVG
jgi:hypothetical protein